MRASLFMIGCAALAAVAAMERPAPASPLVCRQGRLALEFDENTGSLRQIACDGKPLAEDQGSAMPVTFAAGPSDKIAWCEQMGFAPKLLRHASPAPDTLELTFRAGPFELTETYKLYGDPPRVDRRLRLVNRGDAVVKLRRVAFRTPGVLAAGDGFYRFPMQWPPGGQRFAEMQPGRRMHGSGSNIAPLLAELSPRQTLLWTSYTDDRPAVEVVEGPRRFEVRQTVEAAGYLRPNQPQDVGSVSIEVVDAGYWEALPRLWDWMDSVGLRVPADRPAWVASAVLYSFHPGGTIGSGFHDLGGFVPATKQLLPAIPGLGADAVWIMPIEYRSPYWPLDYYRLMDGIGTPEQYRELVARAHALGLHVLQDLVPHGGSPVAVHNREHPEFMLRREDGSTLDYWLNDFALPAWQKYMAGVAGHYVRNYDIDGYRVDACSGSKEMNWNPNIPYARASLSQMRGGLEMLQGIRRAVRGLKPEQGAILAEVESARHQAVADFVYDFRLCYDILHRWRKMEPGPFVAGLQEYLEEQKYAEPRGAVRLRHVESHDALRAQLWYGVQGLRAMYALCAWIDGVPLVYQGMEVGHSAELARINRVRRQRPELSRGEALYRAVKCDVPGVFTCLRRLGHRTSVVAINFNGEPVTASLQWSDGKATLQLDPLAYAVLPQTAEPGLASPGPNAAPPGAVTTLGDSWSVAGATAWFVDTVEGRLQDTFAGPRGNGRETPHSSIYWRSQNANVLWQNAVTQLYPGAPRLGLKQPSGRWKIVSFDGPTAGDLRLAERDGDSIGLRLLGARGLKARVYEDSQPPAAVDPAAACDLGGVKLRCVGPHYIVSNGHYEVQLNRQGGTIRQLRVGGATVLENQDLYGDQEFFTSKKQNTSRIAAGDDVECGIVIRRAGDGLHLSFAGQLRGTYRFALHRPPLWYHNELVFSGGPQFTQSWAFRSEQTFRDKKAFLCYWIPQVSLDHFLFSRGGRAVAEGAVEESSARRGQTKGKATPDTIVFQREGKPALRLIDLQTPAGCDSNLFMQGRKFFLTLLEGNHASMEAARWYEFRVTFATER